MAFYGQMPDSYNVVVNGNHPMVAEILDEVEKGYGEDLDKINKKIDAAVSEQNSLHELIKDKKEADLTSEEKEKRDDLNKKVDDLRHTRSRVLGELGKENKLVKQLIDLALLANGMLKGEELTRFIHRSVDLIGTNKCK